MTIADGLRLVGPPGSNKVMAGELSRLAARGMPGTRLVEPRKAGPGALIYPYDAALAELALTYARTPSRVLRDLYVSDAERLEPLAEEIARDAAADTRAWAHDGAAISIRARNVGEFAAGGLQVLGAVKNGLIDGARSRGLRLRVDPDRPDVLLALRMHDRTISLSVDLAGQALHLRGYRGEGGEAPLRENLAAILVMLCRHDARREILLDPMCGSGTIAIEAALMGRGEPLRPGAPALFPDTRPVVVGNELHTPTMAAARANVAAAGADAHVRILHGDFRAMTPEKVMRAAGAAGAMTGGVILCNPPYGARLDREDPVPIYRELGVFCRQFRGWRAGFLVANRDFEHAFGAGRPRITKPLRNASQPATFYLYDL
ncbi:MAG TPA: hypothetical protein VMZ28_29325 [Kofleriaceae bacterium]|nr:hypothetical protein [Kofleriaceae bacterium]